VLGAGAASAVVVVYVTVEYLVLSSVFWQQHILEHNVRHDVSVLLDHTQKPDVIPTARHMKYFSINTE